MVPPLRDRREDIPLLAEHFLQLCKTKLNRTNLMFNASAMPRLARYDWPGNIRELQNVIERAAILAAAHVVEIDERVLAPSLKQVVVHERPVTFMIQNGCTFSTLFNGRRGGFTVRWEPPHDWA